MFTLPMVLMMLAISGVDGLQCRQFKWDQSDGLKKDEMTDVDERCFCERTYYMKPTCADRDEEGYFITANYTCETGLPKSKLSGNSISWKLQMYCQKNCDGDQSIDLSKTIKGVNLAIFTNRDAKQLLQCHFKNMETLLGRFSQKVKLPIISDIQLEGTNAQTTKVTSNLDPETTTSNVNGESKSSTSKGNGGRDRADGLGGQKGTTTSGKGNGDQVDQGAVATSIPDKEGESTTGTTKGEQRIGLGEESEASTPSSVAPPKTGKETSGGSSVEEPHINVKSSSEKPTTTDGSILPGDLLGIGKSSSEEPPTTKGSNILENDDQSTTTVEAPIQTVESPSEKPPEPETTDTTEATTTIVTSGSDSIFPATSTNGDAGLIDATSSTSKKPVSTETSEMGMADETSATTLGATTSMKGEQGEVNAVSPTKTTEGDVLTTETTTVKPTTVATTIISTTAPATTVSITTTTAATTTTVKPTTPTTITLATDPEITSTATKQDDVVETTTSLPNLYEESTITSPQPEDPERDVSMEPSNTGEDTQIATTATGKHHNVENTTNTSNAEEKSTVTPQPQVHEGDATEKPDSAGEDTDIATPQDETNKGNGLPSDGEGEHGDGEIKTETDSDDVTVKPILPKRPVTGQDGEKSNVTVPPGGTNTEEIVEDGSNAKAAELRENSELEEIIEHNRKADDIAMSLLSGLLVLMTLLSGGMIAIVYLLMVVMDCRPTRF